VTAPDGTEWAVGRRREPVEAVDVEGRGFFDTQLGWLVSLAAIAAFVGVFVVSELAALVLAATLAVVELVDQVRKAGGPWLVEAQPSGSEPGQSLRWRVHGWRRSRQVVEEVARSLEGGHGDIAPAGTERL
jgi:hypothetical protein